ncbi:MAG: helix-turn-helix transcriptional regulator [Pseudomonadota bacterium]
MEKLGTFLASTRNKLGLTLRAVEKRTGISNAYLSQLEHGRIGMPAPQNLHKLAEVYRLPYELLMELAGHPVPRAETANAKPRLDSFSARIGSVTKEEEEALVEFLQFIRSKKRGR